MSGNAFSLLATALALLSAGCSSGSFHRASAHSGERSSPDLMRQYGCPACHVIPHVPGAVGKVGPSLLALNQRSYLASTLPNSPENLERWIIHPQRFQPGTAMPEMGVSDADARAIADFLLSAY